MNKETDPSFTTEINVLDHTLKSQTWHAPQLRELVNLKFRAAALRKFRS